VVLYTIAVGVANKVSMAQFDTKRVSIPSTSVGRYQGINTKYSVSPTTTVLDTACVSYDPLYPVPLHILINKILYWQVWASLNLIGVSWR